MSGSRQIKQLLRQVEIGQQQVQQFIEENNRLKQMIGQLNGAAKQMQAELVLMNAKSIAVTKALVLKGGLGPIVHVTNAELERASRGYAMEKVNEGDPDSIPKEDGDLLLRVRETTAEEQAQLAAQQQSAEKVEAKFVGAPPAPSVVDAAGNPIRTERRDEDEE
jgi:hypothetical protein